MIRGLRFKVWFRFSKIILKALAILNLSVKVYMQELRSVSDCVEAQQLESWSRIEVSGFRSFFDLGLGI